jgi:FMN phosphatase YigB (HAD superfamily)
MKKHEAVLFDLDNTLIFFDERKFFERYIQMLAPVFSDVWPFDQFYKRLIESVQALLQNDGVRTNAERFMEHFSKGKEDKAGDLWDRFLRFYSTEFDRLRSLVRVPDGNPEVFEKLKSENVKLVVASNPVWPLSVQEKRLEWAGLRGFPFDLITHIENTSFCKPRIEYYREICRLLGVNPKSCLMVGNDLVNDMVVAKIGMKTYFVNSDLADSSLSLSRELRKHADWDAFRPDFQGPLSGVPAAAVHPHEK